MKKRRSNKEAENSWRVSLEDEKKETEYEKFLGIFLSWAKDFGMAVVLLPLQMGHVGRKLGPKAYGQEIMIFIFLVIKKKALAFFGE